MFVELPIALLPRQRLVHRVPLNLDPFEVCIVIRQFAHVDVAPRYKPIDQPLNPTLPLGRVPSRRCKDRLSTSDQRRQRPSPGYSTPRGYFVSSIVDHRLGSWSNGNSRPTVRNCSPSSASRTT